jgi:N,N'-diacetyllegionaminate synthase
MKIKVSNKFIGDEVPSFIIAEAGVNHNGDLELAKKLIIEAKEAGADCIKFQTFKADRLASSVAPKANYQLRSTDPNESQLDMLRKLELSSEAYYELIGLCKKLDIIFMSTPYNDEDVLLLNKLGVDAFKLPSISIVEPSLLRFVAQQKKPVIISTGMSTINEVINGVNYIKSTGNKNIVALQCTTDYPTSIEDVNLRAMLSIKQATEILVGFSDHTQNNLSCIAAVTMGASVIEKHFTLDKNLPGPDQSSSYTPKEFKGLVRDIRDVEKILGSCLKAPTITELRNIKGMRRSIVAKVDIPAGVKISENMLSLMRPLTGIPAIDIDTIVGKVAYRHITKDKFIDKEDLS